MARIGFKQLQGELAKKSGVKNPAGLAAAIGAKKGAAAGGKKPAAPKQAPMKPPFGKKGC